MTILLFLACFGIFLWTGSGTIPAYRDSGDLIASIHTLGIAHPPGYPFYIVSGKLFSLLVPWANPAYRVNAFSALMAAASVALIYQLAKRLTDHDVWTSLAAAILYASTPALFHLAHAAEMYSMAGLLAALILWCTLIGTTETMTAGWYLLGLAMGIQPVLIFLAPVLLTDRRYLLQRAGFFALGASIILFLLIRAGRSPVVNWGNPSDIVSLWKIITRSYYGGLKLHPTESQFSWDLAGTFRQLSYFIQTTWRQWGWLGSALGLLGIIAGIKKRPLIFASWVLTGPMFFLLSNLPIDENTTAPILEPYLVVGNVLWAVWIAYGLTAVLALIPPRFQRLWARPALLIAALVTLGDARTVERRSERNDFYAYELGRNLMRSLPPQAVVYDPDDQVSFTLRVLQIVEKRRSDIIPLNFFQTAWGYRQIAQRWPDLLPPYPLRNAQELQQALWSYSYKRRPFYTDLPLKIPPPFTYAAEGIAYHILEPPSSATPESMARSEALFAICPWRGDWRTDRVTGFFTQHIMNYYASAHCNLGLEYAALKKWPEARRHYLAALCIDPSLAAAYNDLALVDFENKQYGEAVRRYRQAVAYDPKNTMFWKNLAIAYEAAGDPAQAKKALEHAEP